MALTHILLRDVKRGNPGSRKYTRVIKLRFQLWYDGNYSALIQGWQQDAQRITNPPKNRTGRGIKTHNTIQAVDLAKKSQVRRAARKVSETEDKANIQAPEIQTQAQANYPRRQKDDYWGP